MTNYRIRESGIGNVSKSIHDYEDLGIHHPSYQGNQPGRVYADVEGRREEVLGRRGSIRRDNEGNLYVTKDFVLRDPRVSDQDGSIVPVPSPVSGVIGEVDAPNGRVTILDESSGDMIAQIRHMDLAGSRLQIGQVVSYAEPLGVQGRFHNGGPDPHMGRHTHIDFNTRYLDQFRQYIRDIDTGVITIEAQVAALAERQQNPSVLLQRGARGPAVGQLQAQLRDLGYNNAQGQPLVIDDQYGPSTQQAVEAFQRDRGLEATGIANLRTMEVLRQARFIGQPDAPYLQTPEANEALSAYRPLAEVPLDVSQVFPGSTNEPLASTPSQSMPSFGQPDVSYLRDPNTADTLADYRAFAPQLHHARLTDIEPAPVFPAMATDIDANAIHTIQKHLNTLGVADHRGQSIPTHGDYDDRTRIAVMSFQMEQGLPVTGIPDVATRSLIEARAVIAELQQFKAQALEGLVSRTETDNRVQGAVTEELQPVSPVRVSRLQQQSPTIETGAPQLPAPQAANESVSSPAATPDQASLTDPRHPRSPSHALYQVLHERIPEASERRLLQFTAACHQNGITAKNLGDIHFDEARCIMGFASTSFPRHMAGVDLHAPMPTHEQAVQQIQQHDQHLAQVNEQILSQNVRINAQTQQGPVL